MHTPEMIAALEACEVLLLEAATAHLKATGRDGRTITKTDSDRVVRSYVVYMWRLLGGATPEGEHDYYVEMVEKMLGVVKDLSQSEALRLGLYNLDAAVRLQAHYITEGLFDAEE